MLQQFKDALPALIVIATLIITVLLLGKRARQEDKRKAEYNDYIHSEREKEFYKGVKKDSRA